MIQVSSPTRQKELLIRAGIPAIHAEDYRLRRSGQLYQSEIISKYNQKQEDCCINDQVCVTVFCMLRGGCKDISGIAVKRMFSDNRYIFEIFTWV